MKVGKIGGVYGFFFDVAVSYVGKFRLVYFGVVDKLTVVFNVISLMPV